MRRWYRIIYRYFSLGGTENNQMNFFLICSTIPNHDAMTAILIRKKRGATKCSDFADDLNNNERLPPTIHIKEDLVLGVLSAGKSVKELFLN